MTIFDLTIAITIGYFSYLYWKNGDEAKIIAVVTFFLTAILLK